MKKLDENQMILVNGGSTQDIINGVCTGASAAGIYAAVFALSFTGIGVAVGLAIGAACVQNSVGGYL